MAVRSSKLSSLCRLFLFSAIVLLILVLYQHQSHKTNGRDISAPFTEDFRFRRCTEEESTHHGNLFTSLRPEWSSCYADLYLLAFENHPRPVQNLIDVGANKAYAIAAWLVYFLPQLNISPARLGKFLSTVSEITYPCGSCNDCEDEPLKKTVNQSAKLQIHAFEPQPGTIHVLQRIYQWMNVSESDLMTLKFHGMAVSDRTGQTVFKKCNPGNEVCSLDVSNAVKAEQVVVNVTALDDFAKECRLDIIDILKIDTEGFDPLVFRGAQRLISEHRIRLFVSEHLQEGAWLSTSLKKETSQLLDLGYVCYVVGKTGLIRISLCWNDQFNTRHSNILCVSSRDRQLLFNVDQLRLNGTVPIQMEAV